MGRGKLCPKRNAFFALAIVREGISIVFNI